MVAISAGEIVAWKGPLGQFSESDEPKVRLEKPPEASPFFQPGDRLWDPGKRHFANPEDIPNVEWVVWNETAHTLVTKCGTEDIWRLRNFLRSNDTPRHCRVKMEVFETQPNELVTADAKPVVMLEWVAASRMKSSAVSETGGRHIKVEVEATVSGDGESIDSPFAATIRLPGRAGLEIKSQLTLKSGLAAWIAEDRDDQSGIEVRITASVVLGDGTPFADLVRVQEDGEARPFVRPLVDPEINFERRDIDANAWLNIARIPIGVFINDEAPAHEADPFVEPTASAEDRLAKLKVTAIPERIRKWIAGPVLDARELFESRGIRVEEGRDFAAYDVRGRAFFLLTGSPMQADKFQALSMGCSDLPLMIATTCNGGGESRVLTRSGTKASIVRRTDKKSEIRRFNVEPEIDDGRNSIGVRIEFDSHPSPDKTVGLKTSATLWNGRSLEVRSSGDGEVMRVGAEIVSPLAGKPARYFGQGWISSE